MTQVIQNQLAAVLPDAANLLADASAAPTRQFERAYGRDEYGFCPVINFSGVVVPETLSLLREAIEELRLDDRCSELIMRVNSPGGFVTGVPEAATIVRRFAAAKPLTVIAEGYLCSAAFWVFSGASRIVASPSCLIGSLGVVRVLVDDSEAFERAGIRVLAVGTSRAKTFGIPGTRIEEHDLERVRHEIEQTKTQFQRDLRLGGRGTAQQREDAFESGDVWRAAEAKKRGLVDQVAIPEDVVREKLQAVSQRHYLHLEGEEAARKLEHLIAARAGCEDYGEADTEVVNEVKGLYPELAARVAKYYRSPR